MTQKTSNTHDQFHINLSDSAIYPNIYESFLQYEPIEPSQDPAFETHACSVNSFPEVESQTSVSSEPPEIPEIQETTHQVPCGAHSIFDPVHKVPAFEKALYLKVNEHSHWDTGVSHALSLRRLAELLNVKSHSQIHRGLQWLIDNGWLMVEGKRKADGAFFYRVIHHKCEPQDTPVDKDGRPLKCAVPMGKGSPSQLLANGKITWRVFVDWTVRKVHSDWTTGVVRLSVRETAKLIGFTPETIKQNAEEMVQIGLLHRISKRFRRSVYQMFPKPYPDRRKRSDEACITKKAMKFIKGWYHSYNGLWRLHGETFDVKMRETDGRWRYSTLDELFSINRSIHRDFCEYISRLSELYGTRAQA